MHSSQPFVLTSKSLKKILMNALFLVLVVIGSIGCSGNSRAATPPLVVPRLVKCLQSPPPVPPEIAIAGPEEGCPPEWEGCLNSQVAGKLGEYLSALQKWARDAYISCGPEKGETK